MTLSVWEQIRRRFLRRGPRYSSNFVKTPHGNGIAQGTELVIRVRDAEVVTGRVYSIKTKRTYQIDQSHPHDEDKDVETTNFTLKSKVHPDAIAPDYNLPRGEYMLLTWWWDNDTMRGGTYKDKFVIF